MRVSLILLVAIAPVVAASGQTAEPIRLARLTGPVQLDGRSDEAAWQAVAPFPMSMYEPTNQGPPSEATDVRVAYDEGHLYVAGRFYDREAAGIRASSLYRDETGDGDRFRVILDTFNDNENALVFWTTPAGVRGDLALAADGRSANASWNTYWDVVAVQTAEGWFVEMRIPFSSLGFQPRDGRVVMGLVLARRIARKNEEVVFPALTDQWRIETPSQAQDVELEAVSAQKPVYVTPYVLGGLGKTARLNPATAAYRMQHDVARDLGLDVKYNVTSNLTLDLTVNTDFAQAEADDQQVNLTRYSIFFPEKRPFFQERAGIFSFDTRNARLFHSRRIGLRDGHAVPILGGTRLVGRVGAWDVGLLDMQTARSGDVPAENFGVARLRRQVFNPNSVAGAIVTSRLDADGQYNLAYGLDGVFRVFGDEYLSLNWAQTFDGAAIRAGTFDAARAGQFEARWDRRRQDGWTYYSSVTWAGEDYLPGIGVMRRRNYTEVAWLLHVNRYPGADSRFRRTMPFHLEGNVAYRNTDGGVESAQVTFMPMVWFKHGASVMLSGDVSYEDLQQPLSFFGRSTVAVGGYAFARASAAYTTSLRSRFRTSVSGSAGQFYDGWRADVAVRPQWVPSRHLQLSASYGLNSVRFHDRGEGFDAHLVGLRAQAALDTRASVAAFVQYNSAFHVASANVRLRYNFREGNDLWLVYNEGLNTDRGRLDPVLPLTSERTLLLKYTHTFDLRNR